MIFIIAISLGVRVTQASALANMDMKSLQTKLGLSDHVKVVRKAQELVRLSNVHFNSSSFGVVCIPSIHPSLLSESSMLQVCSIILFHLREVFENVRIGSSLLTVV